LVEDALQDAMLLIGEERGERIECATEITVDEADEFRKIGFANCGA